MQHITREDFTDIILSSAVRPRLKRELRFVPEEVTDWENRDFLAVMNRAGSEGVLVVPHEEPMAIPFALRPRSANTMGRVESIICDICATWQRGTQSASITFPRDKSSVSFLVCADLNCSLHVRDKTTASKLSRAQLRENIDVDARIIRLRERLHQIITTVR